MNNKKRIIGLLLALLLVASVAIAVIADDTPVYDGKLTTMQKKIDLIDSAESLDDKLTNLDGAIEYLERINPEDAAYAGFVSAIDSRELYIASLYVEIALSKTTADAKLKEFCTFDAWYAEHPFAESAGYVDNKGTPDDTSDDTAYDYPTFVAKLGAVKSAIAESYLNESIMAEKASDKHTALDGLKSFAETYAPAYTAVYTAEAVGNENFACAKLLLDDVDSRFTAEKIGSGLRLVKGFMKDHTFPDTVNGYSSFVSDLSQKTSAYEKAVSDAKHQLELLAHLGDYSKIFTINRDFNNIEGQTSIYSSGTLTAENNVDGEINYITENDSGADGNNGYYTISFGKNGTHIRTNAAIPTTITDSLVFEFDITTFDHLPNTAIVFENGSKSVNGKSLNRNYFRITSDGTLKSGDDKRVLLSNVVTPGQWTHIALVLDQVTNYMKLYVDYVLVDELSMAHAEGYTNVFERIRIGATATVPGGSISLDNVRLYAGYAPRANDTYNKYNDDNKFIFTTKQITNANLSDVARVEYYKEAEKNVSKYWDGSTYTTSHQEVRSAVDSFFSFTDNGYDSLIETIEAAHLEEFTSLITKIENMAPSESTYAARTYFADATDAFLTRSGSYLPDGDAASDLRSRLDAIRVQLSKEDVLLEFANAVKKFFVAATLSDLKAAAAKADALYESIDRSILAVGNFPSYDSAYERYLTMHEYLADNITIDNTKTLVAYINYVLPYDNEESWSANYDMLKSFVAVARSIIDSGDYDIYYSNTAELLASFAPINEYFYTRLQNDHLSYISSEILRYEESGAYFEKYGILVKLNDYYRDNEMDYDNAEIAAYKAFIDAELAELEKVRESYAELLEENTAKFIECCAGLVGSISYTEMKKICTEAAGYYYAMNVMGPDAQDAIAVYAKRCAEIEAIEANAELFIAAVAGFDAEEADALATIILASGFVNLLEENITGVSEALVRYNTEITIFNSAVERGNREILASFTCALALSNTGSHSSLVTSALSRVTK